MEEIDYEDTFAPVDRYTSIHTIIALAASMGWKLHTMDVKTTFLNGEIGEEVYIEQSEGFVVHNEKSHVCRLKKALYRGSVDDYSFVRHPPGRRLSE